MRVHDICGLFLVYVFCKSLCLIVYIQCSLILIYAFYKSPFICMLKPTLYIRDQSARYMRSFLGLCLLQKPTFNCVHSVQSDLEICLLQKPIYMYVEANIIYSGSECTIYAVFSWCTSYAKAYV